MVYLYILLFVVIILIFGTIVFTSDREIRKNRLTDILTGIIVTCFGFVIASFITTELDKESKKDRLINYLILTKEYYSNYLHAKNITSSVSHMMLNLQRLSKEPIGTSDSLNYAYLTIPDLYERFITDESIYILLSDEMKNDIIRFREENQIYKLEFDNIKSLDKKVSFLGELTMKFDEQIETLDIEKNFQLENITREQFLQKREIVFQNKFNLNKPFK
jgi:hypothetical protein